jgi:hypothetical protein
MPAITPTNDAMPAASQISKRLSLSTPPMIHALTGPASAETSSCDCLGHRSARRSRTLTRLDDRSKDAPWRIMKIVGVGVQPLPTIITHPIRTLVHDHKLRVERQDLIARWCLDHPPQATHPIVVDNQKPPQRLVPPQSRIVRTGRGTVLERRVVVSGDSTCSPVQWAASDIGVSDVRVFRLFAVRAVYRRLHISGRFG